MQVLLSGRQEVQNPRGKLPGSRTEIALVVVLAPCLALPYARTIGTLRIRPFRCHEASGFLSKTAPHPRLQKGCVFPACSEEAAARLGSSGIPQTGSCCPAVDRVAILKSLPFVLSTLQECGQSKAERDLQGMSLPESCQIR